MDEISNFEPEKENYKLGDKIIIIAIFSALIILALLKACSDGGTIQVATKEVKGSMKSVKPENTAIAINYSNSTQKVSDIDIRQNLSNQKMSKEYFNYQNEINKLLKENDDLDNAFHNANDSLQQIIYRQAIQLNEFTHTWDNDTLKATVSGISRGEVQSIKLDYTIKSQKIDIKIPQTIIRLIAGLETGTTKDLSKFNIKANLGFQNKRGDMFSVSADLDKRFYIGYSTSIFTIKK